MRIIDADALLDAHIECPEHISFFDFGEMIELFVRTVDAQPTVDAVPVVRCKECKWWWKVNGLCTHPKHCHDNVCVHECDKDYFCADGERRTE